MKVSQTMMTSSISVTSGSLIKRVYNIHAKSKDTADTGLTATADYFSSVFFSSGILMNNLLKYIN